MKKQTFLKAFVLSLAMAVGMLLPTTMVAQSDGFFRGGNDIYEDRDNGIGLGEAEQDQFGFFNTRWNTCKCDRLSYRRW